MGAVAWWVALGNRRLRGVNTLLVVISSALDLACQSKLRLSGGSGLRVLLGEDASFFFAAFFAALAILVFAEAAF